MQTTPPYCGKGAFFAKKRQNPYTQISFCGKIKAENQQGEIKMPTATVCLQSANDFKQYLQENEKSPLTVEKYLRDALFFCRFAAGEEVTKQTVLAFKNHLRERYAPASVNSMLVAVNSFLLFLGKGECRVKLQRIQRQIFCREEKSSPPTNTAFVALLLYDRKKRRSL